MYNYNTIAYLLFSIFSVLQTANAQDFSAKLQAVLDSTYMANQDAVGILMHIESPDHQLSWSGAAGFSDENKSNNLKKEQPVLIASNTKTYISASILKLVENKKLQLDQSIQNIISEKTRDELMKAGYDVKAISVRHLLSHTSGISDYVTEEYFNAIDKDKQHKWTRDEQIALAMKIAEPKTPGDSFAYGDINYLLLSEILENKTQKDFYTAVRELLAFDKNNLQHTWFINLEEKPKNTLDLAHQYATKYAWDSYRIDPSWDLYGGGGLAANAKDMALFFQLLFEGKIIKDKALLSEMYRYVLPKEVSRNYCLGLYHLPSFFGNQAFYHGGWWGTDVIYLPKYNTTIAVVCLTKEKRDLNAVISNRMLQILINP